MDKDSTMKTLRSKTYFTARWLKQFTFNNGFTAMFSKKTKLLYLKNENNFGDVLNENIMDYLGIDYVISPALLANMTCVGSLLDTLLLRDEESPTMPTLKIYGTGFMYPPPPQQHEAFNRNVNIYALRGKLSRKRCEKILNRSLSAIPLGDPGLLVNRIFPTKALEKTHDVGIILHMFDAHISIDNLKLDNLKVKFIDIKQAPQDFVQEVSKCKFIFSSAMHGLICADSLGIPNKHIILSNKVLGGSYKFKDYYSVFNNYNYSPVDIRKTTITKLDVKKFTKEYNIAQKDVNHICDQLEQAAKKLSSNITLGPKRNQP
jgi:hypothetical protein